MNLQKYTIEEITIMICMHTNWIAKKKCLSKFLDPYNCPRLNQEETNSQQGIHKYKDEKSYQPPPHKDKFNSKKLKKLFYKMVRAIPYC